MKKGPLVTGVVALGSTVAFAMGVLNLPLDPVTVTHGLWPHGSTGGGCGSERVVHGDSAEDRSTTGPSGSWSA